VGPPPEVITTQVVLRNNLNVVIQPLASKPKRQRDAAYIIGRLKKEKKTKLAEQVIAGEMSAHAAALEAGIRIKRISEHSLLRPGAYDSRQNYKSNLFP